jgi:hypothetical protein
MLPAFGSLKAWEQFFFRLSPDVNAVIRKRYPLSSFQTTTCRSFAKLLKWSGWNDPGCERHVMPFITRFRFNEFGVSEERGAKTEQKNENSPN